MQTSNIDVNIVENENTADSSESTSQHSVTVSVSGERRCIPRMSRMLYYGYPICEQRVIEYAQAHYTGPIFNDNPIDLAEEFLQRETNIWTLGLRTVWADEDVAPELVSPAYGTMRIVSAYTNEDDSNGYLPKQWQMNILTELFGCEPRWWAPPEMNDYDWDDDHEDEEEISKLLDTRLDAGKGEQEHSVADLERRLHRVQLGT